MGMGPMPGMFGNLGSPGLGMAGVNGMNVGMNMNFNPNQGAYGGWNNGANMWNGAQNNNPNAFSNGMGGDFGPNAGYGYNMSPQGNFPQQQYPNGDFQAGYHGRGSFRGRGRGRGGLRGRGGYNAHGNANANANANANFHGNGTNNYQPPYEQQQAQIQQLQAQLGGQSHPRERSAKPFPGTTDEQLKAFHDELAPGGQEEVDEALGVDSTKPDLDEIPLVDTRVGKSVETGVEKPAKDPAEQPAGKGECDEDKKGERQDGSGLQPPEAVVVEDQVAPVQAIATVSPTREESPAQLDVPEAYKEDLAAQQSMPPPTAPIGPAARFSDTSRDHAFRGRGLGRFASRGRGSSHLSNGIHAPSKPAGDAALKAPTEPKGAGIVGAPTGPKAMRAATVPPTGPRGRGGGFQIVGRAAMMNKENRSVSGESDTRYATLLTRHSHLLINSDRNPDHKNEARSRPDSPSYQDDQSARHHATSNYDAESDDERRRRHERRHRRSRRDEHENQEMQNDVDYHHSRTSTPDSKRKSSHRRRDKERHSSDTKHRSSHRSHRHRDDETENERQHEDEPASSRRSKPDTDLPTETESRSSSHREHHHRHHHRSSRSSRHDDKERDRDRGDRDRDREERHRHRKRTRRDRDENDDDDGETPEPRAEKDTADDHHHRHRSRRHKRDHHQNPDTESVRNGTTPTTITPSTHRDLPNPSSSSNKRASSSSHHHLPATDPDIDMHTLERAARDRERQLKEKQRREMAGKGVVGASSRRVSYKYEDEADVSLVRAEREREGGRWR